MRQRRGLGHDQRAVLRWFFSAFKYWLVIVSPMKTNSFVIGNIPPLLVLSTFDCRESFDVG